MANRELNTAVAAETTLGASLTDIATTLTVASSTGFPSVNFPVVLDADDDSKREVVIVTGVSGTTWTVARGQDGTSGVAHDSGAMVALTAVPSLWGDLHDRVEAHTHGGGTDGAAVATGDLTGHTEAAHKAIGLAQVTAQVKDTTGQSITAGTETTLTLDETDWLANCSLASNTLTVDYAGTYRVYANLNGSSSTAPSSGTMRLKVGGVTQATDAVDVGGGGSAFSSTIGATVVAGAAVQTLSLSGGDTLTLTLELTGGSGHSTSNARLAVERIG